MLASFFGEIALIPTFELFGKTFGIYPVLALVGIFTAGIYACRQARKKGLDVAGVCGWGIAGWASAVWVGQCAERARVRPKFASQRFPKGIF